MDHESIGGGPGVRIGAVAYLNSKPLVFDLQARAPQAEMIYGLPSRLADDLKAKRLDVALIPSIEVLRNPSYAIVSDACIACRGRVLSVKLLSRTPISRIRTLALDEGSRTSAMLARILLQQRHGLTPRTELLPAGARPEDSDADAIVVIGDRAIRPAAAEFVEQWDLGEQWCGWTNLPFVFAMWAARPGADLGALEIALGEARDAGVRRMREIAEAEAESVGLTVEQCLGYLRDNLHFYLGPDERRGLESFRELARRLDGDIQ